MRQQPSDHSCYVYYGTFLALCRKKFACPETSQSHLYKVRYVHKSIEHRATLAAINYTRYAELTHVYNCHYIMYGTHTREPVSFLHFYKYFNLCYQATFYCRQLV